MRRRNANKKIILVLVGIVCLMTVGYAAFQTQLNINGTTEISSEWNIKIISAEVSDTGGSAENVKNTYTELTANLEANLYSKGDYVEYKVMVENAGTFDAKLDTLGITNSNNEAVKIASSGLVKGQTLYKGETATLTVRIEYNSNYSGDGSGTSGETQIDLGFMQNSGGMIEPTEDHLVTYDYTTNGGESTTAENQYVAEGESINLSYTATKKGYEFKGWNTNPQASEGLTSLTMGTEDITLYAIFKAIDTTPPVINSINTTSTTNSITTVVNAVDEESGISKYEFSIDGGRTWIDNGNSNKYTFTGLNQETEYEIDVRVTNGINMNASGNTTESTLKISVPTFKESDNGTNIVVTITYPSGCGSTYTCTYIKDDGEEVEVNNSTVDVDFTSDGILVAKVTDGTNTVSSSYTVIRYNLYVSSKGSDTSGTGTISNPYATIAKAYEEAAPTATIYVMDDITVNSATTFDENKNITLTSYSTDDSVNSIIRGNNLTSFIINQTVGTLTLKDITIDGDSVEAQTAMINVGGNTYIEAGAEITAANNVNNYGGGFLINGGTLTINAGEIIQNASFTSGGSAIFIYRDDEERGWSKGTLIMNGGDIYDNSALNGAIFNAGGDFIMNGGEIFNNVSRQLCGGVCNAGYFLMNDGSIHQNDASDNGGGIYNGVSGTSYGNLVIKGGRISHNTALNGGGIHINSGTTATIEDVEIVSNTVTNNGGGIENDGTLYLKGGLIDNNKAENVGGGIHNNLGTLIINGGIISNNSAISGGGIRCTGTSVTNIENIKIINNKAISRGGGGMEIYSSAKVTMNGGEISGNTAATHGAGVWMSASNSSHTATFTLNGGTIKNNTANSSNGGIYVSRSFSTYTYKSGIVCGNKPSNSYETSSTCPS